MIEHLDCPECGEPALPSSGAWNGQPTWSEDDPSVRCPGCGLLLGVFITGDESGDYCEARVVDEEEG